MKMAYGAPSTGFYKKPMEGDVELDIDEDPTGSKVVGSMNSQVSIHQYLYILPTVCGLLKIIMVEHTWVYGTTTMHLQARLNK
jgi:hypothetical protein